MIAVPSYASVRAALERQGYAFFDQGDYNLNLIGVRAASRRPGPFDDRLLVAFRQAGQPTVFAMALTTDPGASYLRAPINADGAAILKPGQYRGMWEIGLHRSKYTALVQRGVCTVYRDTNRDDTLDDGPSEQTGYFGINLHHARDVGITTDVGNWSAGCQVLADHEEFDLVMALAELAAVRYGKSFTYTLIQEAQL